MVESGSLGVAEVFFSLAYVIEKRAVLLDPKRTRRALRFNFPPPTLQVSHFI